MTAWRNDLYNKKALLMVKNPSTAVVSKSAHRSSSVGKSHLGGASRSRLPSRLLPSLTLPFCCLARIFRSTFFAYDLSHSENIPKRTMAIKENAKPVYDRICHDLNTTQVSII